MPLFRYSRWDGTQKLDPFSADDAMEYIAEKMLDDGDLTSALKRMLQRGAEFPSGRRMAGLQELLERLRESRQRHLQRHNVNSVLDDVRDRLNQIKDTERAAIQQRLDKDSDPQPGPLPEGEGVSPDTIDMLKKLAQRKLDQMDQLPPDVPGQIQQLRDYDFLSPEARQQFQDLMQMLQQQVLQSYFKGLQQGLQSMTPEGLREIRDMLRDLNNVLEGRGDFQDFKDKWGKFFPDDIESAEQLAQHMQRQMAAMQSLLDSMTPEMRQELEKLMESVFQDQSLQQELGRLAGNMQRMFPGQGGEELPFSGDDPLTLQEAMRLMDDMHGLDELEQELLQAVKTNDASSIDADEIGRLVGQEAKMMAEEMQRLTKMLEEAGLISRKGKEWELTPRAMRKIGEKALEDIFGKLDNSLLGNHDLLLRGTGPERLDETKRYVFGDPFALDANRTLMNAVMREPSRPLKLTTDDFEVHRTTASTRCATVIMLDMSYSMMMGGRFQAGRRVALALDSLIRAKFPRDWLRVVAFSYFVLTLEPRMLLDSYWVEYGGGTNFQEALRQARTLLTREKAQTRQIVMITDGEPNTYSYWSGRGSSGGAMAETMREIVRCTHDGIVINTFMMAQEAGLTNFVKLMAKINRGRAFYTSPRHIGAYVLLDYVSNKRRAVS
jgi:uncharacterized protein with von Willebrand factor type A (vWA) domain